MFKRKKEKELTPQEVFMNVSNKNHSLLATMSVDKTSKAINRMMLLRKVFITATSCMTLFMGTAFVASSFYTGSSGFTVRAAQSDDLDKSISLSETRGFSNGSIFLKGPVNPAMDNITYTNLPLEQLNTGEGDHSKDNYLAYSFYLKNSGKKNLDYKYSLNYPRATLGVENAVRVILIKNGEAKIYAAPTVDGKNERYPENVNRFIGPSKIVEAQRENIKPDEVDKFTVVVWLEGEDPECVDAVRKGTMTLEMKFNVINK